MILAKKYPIIRLERRIKWFALRTIWLLPRHWALFMLVGGKCFSNWAIKMKKETRNNIWNPFLHQRYPSRTRSIGSAIIFKLVIDRLFCLLELIPKKGFLSAALRCVSSFGHKAFFFWCNIFSLSLSRDLRNLSTYTWASTENEAEEKRFVWRLRCRLTPGTAQTFILIYEFSINFHYRRFLNEW